MLETITERLTSEADSQLKADIDFAARAFEEQYLRDGTAWTFRVKPEGTFGNGEVEIQWIHAWQAIKKAAFDRCQEKAHQKAISEFFKKLDRMYSKIEKLENKSFPPEDL